MKFRSDFVTNSSSSSFILSIRLETNDGNVVEFNANGGSPESGRIDYFEYDAIVNVSPKQLAEAKDIEELISLLTNGVLDGCEWSEDDGIKVFETDTPVSVPSFNEDTGFDEDFCIDMNPYDFIRDIRTNIKSISDIAKIVISGSEYNYMEYHQTYEYDCNEKKYTGLVKGCEFEKDGSTGGYLNMSDLDDCDISYEDEGGLYR